MAIQNNLIVRRRTRKTLIHLVMIASIVATAAAAFPTTVAAQDSTHQQQQQQQEQQQTRPAAIPFCDDKHERTIGRRLLYVTTLDGRLSALDIAKGGKLRWSIPTGPGPLISSSIHRLELTNNGRFVRMIPSLSGGIYKFDGESIDPIPITTENLLSSSAKFSDDLVISGGKETRTYGVSARTGQLLYECSMNGCINATDAVTSTPPAANEYHQYAGGEEAQDNDDLIADKAMEHDPLMDDVILVRRQTQTVRAVESRTGVERWNFSVGQHELNIIKSAECHERHFSDIDMAMLDLDIKVIVPEGVICAFSKSNPNSMLWKYKFDHPIVSGWKLGSASDELESIDMFGSAQWLWDSAENIFESPFPTMSPSIYMGMYDKQLYIQESIKLRREIVDRSNLYTHLTTSENSLPTIPWRPIPASSNSLMIFRDDTVIASGTIPPANAHNGEAVIQGNELVPYDEDNFALSAQSVLNASEYVNGNGFYFFTTQDLNNSDGHCDESDDDRLTNTPPAIEDVKQEEDGNVANQTVAEDDEDGVFNFDDLDAPVKVVILSLWYWWKEILVIAFTSAVLLNLFIGQRQRTEREIVVIERHIPVPTAMEATESSTAALLGPVGGNQQGTSSKSTSNGFFNGNRSLSESTTHSGEQYSSRFQGDFDLVRCLGRGGFGVVFEAKNKLDDCKYAVKRITLPNKKDSRERVMREVKTLANCEHQNIVRYFQAWVETPPPGWQEEEDNKLLAQEMSTSIQIETPDGTTLPSFASGVQAIECAKGNHLLLDKKKQLLSWVSSVTSVACSSDHDEDRNIRELPEDEEEDEDSLIVFRTHSQSLVQNDTDSDEEVSKDRKQVREAVAIDIHSSSFNATNIDYSHLSDSFQIEFVRPANGDDDGDGDNEDFSDDGFDEDKSLSTATRMKVKSKSGSIHSKRQQLSLDLASQVLNSNHNNRNNNNNNNTKYIGSKAGTPPKSQQNRVYLYIQMQLCRKECLRDWLRENTTELREQHISSIFHQIVDAVDYVHLKGLIHRDLKPSNIFFSQDGQIKIGDFGLVTDMADIPNLVTKCGDKTGLPSCSRHTQQVGTHLYMSPEQLRGQHYDYKVDIYSLGLIFFELLMYFGTEMERIVTLRDLRVGRYPDKFPADHPAEYELLKRMLSGKPDERPATVELKRELNVILKLPDVVGDCEAAAIVEAARRLSRSRTFSINE